MKKIHYLLSALFFSVSLNSSAASLQEECNDLADMTANLNTVAEAFNLIDEIKEGDEVDQALGEVVDAMILVAEAENTPRLTSAVDDLSQAYNNLDSEQFENALDRVITYMDRMYVRECN